MKTQTDKKKITVQLWKPLLKKLNAQIASSCLNRDAYLDKVFAHEAKMLRQELHKKRNSDKAKARIKECFAGLTELVPMSLTLSVETANALTSACEDVNVWRDAFVNRVIYLLVARPEAIESQLGFTFADHQEAIFDEGLEIRSILLGPRLLAIRSFIEEDPFLAIREALRQEYPDDQSDGLHGMTLGNPAAKENESSGIAGLNVYLDDFLVPGTKENEMWSKDVLAELGL